MTVELRRATRSDAEFLLDLVGGEGTREFLGRPPETLDDVIADIERSESQPQLFGWLVAEADGERVGSASYRVLSENNRIVEGGRLAVHPRFRGRRLGDDIARSFQRLVLRDLGFHRLELQVYGFNERAIAHAHRVGYVHEGTKRKAYRRRGEWQDALLFSMLDDELPERLADPERS
jgi:RimJ/RimL family protein N-acetyltransferase